jgi:hypothetical protein
VYHAIFATGTGGGESRLLFSTMDVSFKHERALVEGRATPTA